MNIVGITACTAGIAHTYIAKEKLIQAALSLGHNIKVETQGSIGVDDKLSLEDIAKADIVIFATDIGIGGLERFKDKQVVEVPISTVVKSPKSLIQKIQEKMQK
ncbi:PTS fructose transporter subunit IIB [Klebsiella oxytoca]|uniref:PTS fructose transporter subunit IIB n=1 Tax=Klebsiella oxytoca TaxID=571 RepID=UPI00157AC35D|nr:PTS fructose transporter subunit IIB [Klebsiella oxytoca]